MTTALRSSTLVVAFILGLLLAAPAAMAQTKEEKAAAKAAAKVASIVQKTASIPGGKLDKVVDGYAKKVDKLVISVEKKVLKMRAKDMPEEMITQYITDAIMNKGMVYAQQARNKLTTTRAAAERSLVKYGSPAAAMNSIRAATEDLLSEVDEIWDQAAIELHAMEAI